MGSISLVLSLLFSAVLIIWDCKRRRQVSGAVWIPTILVFVLGSRPVSDWVGMNVRVVAANANDQATSIADQLFYFLILASSLAVVLRRKFQWQKLLANNSAIVLFYLYFAISIAWSTDPVGSTKRIIKDFGLLFVAGILFTEADPFDAMRAVYVRSAAVTLPLSIVFIKYFPQLGRQYSFAGELEPVGVTVQKNTLGETTLLLILFLVWDYLEKDPARRLIRTTRVPWSEVLLLIMAIQLLLLSQSKTALVCALISVTLLLRGNRFISRGINKVVLYGALSLPLLLFFSQQFSEVIAPLLAALGRDMTFTGRTDIWTHITLHTVNPIIGEGYWNFWGGPGAHVIDKELHGIVPNAHNGYLDIYLDGGFLGLAFLLGLLISCGERLVKRLKAKQDPNRFQRIRFAILIVLIIYDLSESSFARTSTLWFTSLLMIAEYPRKHKTKTIRQEQLGSEEWDNAGLERVTIGQPI